MTIFDVYLGREFHATQELEYREIDDLHIHIGQNIQQQQKKICRIVIYSHCHTLIHEFIGIVWKKTLISNGYITISKRYVKQFPQILQFSPIFQFSPDFPIFPIFQLFSDFIVFSDFFSFLRFPQNFF